MHITQLINDYRNYKNKDKMHKIKYVKDIIQDLENYGPASLIHIAILSNILKRRINIWNANGNLNKIIGRKKLGPSIDIEYHANNSEQIGHWTLRGSKDPDNVTLDLNSCLFSVIGSQIGQDPLKLRKWTVLKLKDNFQNLAKWLDKIPMGNAGIFLMIGGVNGHRPRRSRQSREGYSRRYPAHSQEKDATKILDDSENVEGEGDVNEDLEDLIGHSREKHVVGGRNGGVEVYTRINKCLGVFAFQTEKDQDYVLHRALLSKLGQRALRKLDDTIAASAEIYVSKLIEQNVPFPKASYWYAGNKLHESAEVKGVSLKLRHHKNKRKEKNAKPHIVFIFPFFEVLKLMKCPEGRPHEYRDYIRELTGYKYIFASTFGNLEDFLTRDGYSKRYIPPTEDKAKQILDNSEGKFCVDDPKNPLISDLRKGHARSGHVERESNGVEAYSKKNICEEKTAFRSEKDQNYILHRALLSTTGQAGLVLLNKKLCVDISVLASHLSENGASLPTGSIWHNGEKKHDKLQIEMVHIQLGHHRGQEENNSAEPLVVTMFPVLEIKTKKDLCDTGKEQEEQKSAQAAPETASATTSKPASQTPPKRATGAIPKIRKTAPKTASPTTSKPASKTPKIALKTATGTIRKIGHVTTPGPVHKITPTTSHKPTLKSTRKPTSKITRKTAP
ncbi:uncharacterized protein LOC118646004 [Monomorium pharaonis]|uniref:uncharacterized protein LOC118646004 n=1 Tax=Monomorium pharaonis TaxID=307658 RepID=UPI0017479765|nr:uncharacterized protein LOC118646004 [Monomorium pharaonis]